jgi:uncharacterized protein
MTETKAPSGQTATMVFSLTASDDRMEMRLSCPAATASTAGLLEEIEREAARLGVAAPLDRVPLTAALNQAAVSGNDIVDLVIARGQAPQPPQDGSLEWTAPYFTAGFMIDPETKRIDFRQKVEILTVEKGQLLVRVHPPKAGQDGVDVFGRAIKTARAKPAAIRPGRQVVWDEKDQGYRASCEGRIRFTGSVLEVDNVYHITGDVGSATGNIKHNGHLIVDGNIEPDSRVECSGDIDVQGLVYASDIDCGGALLVRSGINQTLAKRMRVAGDVVSKYIHNASLEAAGSVHAATEIFQSRIHSLGPVDCRHGRIVGGEVVSAADIIVGQVGARGDTRTTLAAGLHMGLMQRVQANVASIKQCGEVIRKLSQAHRQAMANPRALTAAQREEAMEMEFKINEAQDTIAELEKQNQTMSREAYAGRGSHILILGTVHPGTVLRIYNAQYVVEEALVGPLAAVLDPVTGEVALTSEIETIMEKTHES